MTKLNPGKTGERAKQLPRYAGVALRKSAGATYTPAPLADFVAAQMLRIALLRPHGSIRILDPAVGDGALLDALLKALPPALRKRTQVRGYDTDQVALTFAVQRLLHAHPLLDVRF